jgi:WD40 repeat protein
MNGSTRIPDGPYKGLARFDDSELDERFFFGRDRETELVASNLVASRLTVLYGPSGVGKSSLLRAGVVRRLRALVPVGGGAGEGDGALPVVVDQWRDDPLLAIAAAAGAEAPGDELGLADVLAERSAEVGGEIYLVLDQMEEYFVYHGRDRGGPLREALAEILTRPTLRVHVLLGIRDDALADLDAFKGRVPGLFANVLRLDHLDVDAARAAIVEPLAELEAIGGPAVEAEPALVAAVVDQVASGRIERRLAGRGMVAGGSRRGRVEAPYLQLVMERLWEVERAKGSSVLRAETLAELGGAGRIVQQHLERALASLDEAERELVARLFHQLVTPSGTKIAHAVGDLSRYAGESPERLEDVLHSLSNERVVRALPGRNGGGARYEIFHDVLANAVLDWGARHEAERELAEERAAARRRHRRLAAIIGLGAVALALMGLLTAYAFDQRGEARDKTRIALAAQLAAEKSAEKAEAEEKKKNDALVESQAAQAQLVKEKNRADEETAAANVARDNEAAQRVIAEDALEQADAETARANEEAARANTERDRADDERDLADGARADAVKSKEAEIVQRKKAESALENEKRAKQEVIVSRDEARANDLVSRAITLQHTDPEQSLRLALQSARIARAPRLEITLRDILKDFRLRSVLPGGGGAVRTVSMSADGSLVLVPSADGDARVFDRASGKLLTRIRHGEPLTAAIFSPDGGTVLTGGTDGVVRRWNSRTGAALPGRSVHGARINQIASSPDGRLFATAAGETARVWLAADGSELQRLRHQVTVVGVSFNPTGTLLMTLSLDARLFRTDDWQRPPIVLDQPGQIQAASFAPVGPLVATGGRDDLAMVWDSRDGSKRLQFVTHGGDVTDLAWSPTADLVATASSDNAGRVFRADTGALVTFLGAHSNQIVSIVFSPDGSQIATSSLDNTARIWGGGVNFARHAKLVGHSDQVLDVAFAPDGKSVVTGSLDGSARVWRTGVDPIMNLVGRHGGVGRAVAFSPDGGLIASVGLDRALRVWRRDGTVVRTVQQPAQLIDVAFSNDGTLIVTAGLDGVARVVRVADWSEIQSFGHGAPLSSAVFDASGRRVLTAGADGIARIWRRTGGAPRELRHGGGAVTAAVFSPDGRFVATAGQNIEGRVWSSATAKLLGKLTGQHDDDLTSIAYSPDGRFLATSSIDADGHIWNARTPFAHVRPLRGHSSLVSDIAFSADGRWLGTAGPTTVGMWERGTDDLRVQKGIPLLFLRGHVQRVWGIAIAPDSRRVASISADGTVRTYLCEVCGTTGELIRKARAKLGRLEANLSAAERAKYLGG